MQLKKRNATVFKNQSYIFLSIVFSDFFYLVLCFSLYLLFIHITLIATDLKTKQEHSKYLIYKPPHAGWCITFFAYAYIRCQ